MEVHKPGDVIDGMKIIAELGRGAASIIYVAQDLKSKQIWALKHVEKETEKDQRFLDQAESEYQIASKIKSPRVRGIERMIRKKESLLGGTSELWLVMELVDGASCERERPQTVEDAVFIFEQTAEGLQAMHDQGFVHADMKPNNIIVDDKLGVKIIDLGQSCKVGTVKQRIQGTPDYIAPEQVHRQPITPKTDVYNLGAAMYWIFTNQYVPTALGKEDSLLGSLDASIMPKPKHVRELNPRVPEALAELIMTCVEIKPEDRPEMGQVHDRLNFIRSRLIAEAQMRKMSGSRTGAAMDGSAGPGGSKSGVNSGVNSGSKGGSKVGSLSPRSKDPPTPPIDPGFGITDE
jgi:eukaryotic-like serine/threonine-protein kinase